MKKINTDGEHRQFLKQQHHRYRLKRAAQKRGNQLVIFTAPPGAGKTSVINAIIELNVTLNELNAQLGLPRFAFTFTPGVTTRALRHGEKAGYDFQFMTRPQFLSRQKRSDFLLSFISEPNFYAVDGPDIEYKLLSADPFSVFIYNLNAWQVPMLKKAFVKKPFVIFLNAPSIHELERRKATRGGMTADEIAFRRKTMLAEIAQGQKTADLQVINDKFAVTIERCARAIISRTLSIAGTPAPIRKKYFGKLKNILRQQKITPSR